jgi:hypothetical protein
MTTITPTAKDYAKLQVLLQTETDRAFFAERSLSVWLPRAEEAEVKLAAAEQGMDAARGEAERLWCLLDDISTAGDMFKPPIDSHFKYINRKCDERDGEITSDGYKLFWINDDDYVAPVHKYETEEEILAHNISGMPAKKELK